jgi:ABC-type nitrate/sulfonate/bicarbonate transport system substrate-binding protein
VVLAGALFVAASMAQAQAGKVTKIRYGTTGGIAYPTMIIAEEKGFFRKEGLEVKTTDLAGSGIVAEALASGNLDLGNASPATSVLAIAKGAKLTLVSGLESTFTDKSGHKWEAVYIASRTGENIKGVQDFKGRRVAVNDLGSIYNYMPMEQLRKAGLDPKKDVTIVPIPFGQMAGALVQKQVDAIIGTYDAIYQVRQRMPVDIIGDQSSMEGLDIGLTSSIAASNDFLKKDPDAVVRFLRALLQARQWLDGAVAANNPEALDIIARVMKYNPDRAKKFWETRGGYYGYDTPFVNTLDITERLIKRQIEILKSAELLPADQSFTYTDFVDISYLRKAYESLGLKWDPAKH